jgi:hypothetical protein
MVCPSTRRTSCAFPSRNSHALIPVLHEPACGSMATGSQKLKLIIRSILLGRAWRSGWAGLGWAIQRLQILG